MDHKDPVSGIGDGVLFWDILKPAIRLDYIYKIHVIQA